MDFVDRIRMLFLFQVPALELEVFRMDVRDRSHKVCVLLKQLL